MTSITIPRSLTKIGHAPFADCVNLTTIEVAAGNAAFSSAGGVLFDAAQHTLIEFPGGYPGTSYAIPNSVTSVGDYAFFGCSGLTSVAIPNGVTSIGNWAFESCWGLTSIGIPNGVTSIGDYAFDYCSGLTSVAIPNGVTSIGDFAFETCSGLTTITIPSSLTTIGHAPFADCVNLTTIEVAAGNAAFSSEGGVLFDAAQHTLIEFPGGYPGTSYAIPNSVASIGDYAFYGCSGLTSIAIPNGVASIGDGVFANCSGLTSIAIPDGVASIGDHAFAYCSGLTGIALPTSVTSIRDHTFYYCSGLTGIAIPNSVTSIQDHAFYYCSGMTNIALPDSVTSIGDSAFCRCRGLTSITIPNRVTSIWNDAFYGCSSMEFARFLGDAPTTFGSHVFAQTAGGFTVRYQPTATGFSSPYWHGYPAQGGKIMPTITWSAPAPITYGTPSSPTQLNATANVSGAFVYSPAAGTVLGGGAHTLHVIFTPTDTIDYANVVGTQVLTVNKAVPVITWAAPAPITYGTALSATQLNARSAVTGTFVYSPAAGTVLSAGARTLHVTLTPNNTTNYDTATATQVVTVNKAVPVITWPPPAAITYGTPLSPTQLNATASVPGVFTYVPVAGTMLKGGTHTLKVYFVPTDRTDYTCPTATQVVTVN